MADLLEEERGWWAVGIPGTKGMETLHTEEEREQLTLPWNEKQALPTERFQG